MKRRRLSAPVIPPEPRTRSRAIPTRDAVPPFPRSRWSPPRDQVAEPVVPRRDPAARVFAPPVEGGEDLETAELTDEDDEEIDSATLMALTAVSLALVASKNNQRVAADCRKLAEAAIDLAKLVNKEADESRERIRALQQTVRQQQLKLQRLQRRLLLLDA